MEMTQDFLKKILSYDPETGVFTWNRRQLRPGIERLDKGWNTRFDGKPAGRPHRHGHIYININYKNYAAHRLAWVFVYGVPPPPFLDHINGNPSDNRICNLRPCSQSQNMRNARLRCNNTSGHKGVYWSKRERKWCAYITVDKRIKVLGRFEDKHEAIEVRRLAATKFFGEFAREGT
jgi:hypothetical protein